MSEEPAGNYESPSSKKPKLAPKVVASDDDEEILTPDFVANNPVAMAEYKYGFNLDEITKIAQENVKKSSKKPKEKRPKRMRLPKLKPAVKTQQHVEIEPNQQRRELFDKLMEQKITVQDFFCQTHAIKAAESSPFENGAHTSGATSTGSPSAFAAEDHSSGPITKEEFRECLREFQENIKETLVQFTAEIKAMLFYSFVMLAARPNA